MMQSSQQQTAAARNRKLLAGTGGGIFSASVQPPTSAISPLCIDINSKTAEGELSSVSVAPASVYMSAHNPQTPSNAQIIILEQDEPNNIAGSDRYMHSHLYESANSIPNNSKVLPQNSRNRITASLEHRSSVEKLNEDRSMTFQMAAEN